MSYNSALHKKMKALLKGKDLKNIKNVKGCRDGNCNVKRCRDRAL